MKRDVLYVGSKTGTSLHRAEALRRKGFEVTHVSPYMDLPRHWALWLSRAGGPGIDYLVARSLAKQIGNSKFSFTIVDSGEVVGPSALTYIRQVSPRVANYSQDNPFKEPPVERRRWSLLRRSAHLYDLIVTPRRDEADALVRKMTGRSPMQVWLSADEVAHRPVALTPQEEARWQSDVIFAGAWMPGRDAFLAGLITAGVPLKIYGLRWERSPHFEKIRSAVQFKFLDGQDYASAIHNAKVALVMLNGANSDLHTTRSAEIPAIGTAMVAPRTSCHVELFRDGEEALFFDNLNECVSQCHRLLNDDSFRRRVAQNGQRRTFQNKTYNEELMTAMILGLSELPEVRP